MSLLDAQRRIAFTDGESGTLKALDDLLQSETQPQLVGPEGEPIALPQSVSEVLRRAVHLLSHGDAIQVIADQAELTPHEASEILNVSRPFLVKLLHEGAIPCIKVGTHYRIKSTDLMTYKRVRDVERHRNLEKLVQLSEELGLYED